jgi:hypothetical protein
VKRYASEKQTAICKSGAFQMEKPTFTDYVTLIFNLFDQFIQESGPERNWFSARYDYEHKTLIVFFIIIQYRNIFQFKAQRRWLKTHRSES